MKIGITEKGDAGYNFDQWKKRIHTVDAAVLITKRPDILLNRITEIPNNTIIHCTITGLSGTLWEPYSIEWEKALKCYLILGQQLGYQRVVLRVDPIIPTNWNNAIQVLKTVQNTNNRVRISFMDLYNHVKKRLGKSLHTIDILKYYSNIHANKITRTWMLNEILKIVPQIEVCGEPDITSIGCISEKDLQILNLQIPPKTICTQRKYCSCFGNKTELLSKKGQCPNKCIYCYWQ